MPVVYEKRGPHRHRHAEPSRVAQRVGRGLQRGSRQALRCDGGRRRHPLRRPHRATRRAAPSPPAPTSRTRRRTRWPRSPTSSRASPKRRDRAFEVLGNFPKPHRRRGQRLRGGHRLHRDLLLRSARRLRPRGVAAAPGRRSASCPPTAAPPASPAGWDGATRCASPWASRSPRRRRTASASPSGWCRTRKLMDKALRGGGAHRVAAAAGRAARQGIAAARPGHPQSRRTPRSSISTASRRSS